MVQLHRRNEQGNSRETSLPTKSYSKSSSQGDVPSPRARLFGTIGLAMRVSSVRPLLVIGLGREETRGKCCSPTDYSWAWEIMLTKSASREGSTSLIAIPSRSRVLKPTTWKPEWSGESPFAILSSDLCCR